MGMRKRYRAGKRNNRGRGKGKMGEKRRNQKEDERRREGKWASCDRFCNYNQQKSGQSFDKVDLFRFETVLSHWQLYVFFQKCADSQLHKLKESRLIIKGGYTIVTKNIVCRLLLFILISYFILLYIAQTSMGFLRD